MMIRQLILLSTIYLLGLVSYGQCIVSLNNNHQIITTCPPGKTYGKSIPASGGVYLGSEYLTFPIWQNGTITLSNTGREINCRICYNIGSNQLLYRLADSTTREAFPDAFSINGTPFIKQAIDGSATKNSSYYKVHYQGKTKFLETFRCDLYKKTNYPFEYLGGIPDYYGFYFTKNYYYLQKGNTKLQLIALTRKSLSEALYGKAEKIAEPAQNEQLTLSEAIHIVASYDSLRPPDSANQVQLSDTSTFTQALPSPIHQLWLSDGLLFTQVLRDKINYPSQAWRQAIYGRVYVGFDVDHQGQIKNSHLVSPENVGYGFAAEVMKAFKKISSFDPTSTGSYILPVSFVYTTLVGQNRETYSPRNTLPIDRLTNRKVLEEISIPVIIRNDLLADKPVQEVWGYYK